MRTATELTLEMKLYLAVHEAGVEAFMAEFFEPVALRIDPLSARRITRRARVSLAIAKRAYEDYMQAKERSR